MKNKNQILPILLALVALFWPGGLGPKPPSPPLRNGKECYNYRATLAVFGQNHLPLNQGQIGTCVAVSGKGVCDGENAVAHLSGKIAKPLPVSAESLYGGRVEVAGREQPRYGDGWYGVGFAKWVTDVGGQVFEKNYAEYGIDLSNGYSVERARDWGQYGNGGRKDGINGPFDREAQKHKFTKRARISTLEELDKALENYHFVQTCSGIGFDSPRDKNGFCARRGSWPHAQFFAGKRTKAVSGYDGYLVQNSWGKYIRGDGPNSPNKYLDQPDGSYYVTPADALAMLRAGDSWIVTYDDFKAAKELPWLHAAYAQVPDDAVQQFQPIPDEISTPVWHKVYSDAYVDSKGSKPLLVFWTAKWCDACKDAKQHVEKVLSDRRGKVSAVILDYDAHEELRKQFGVTSVPAAYLYNDQCRNGVIVDWRRLGQILDKELPNDLY